MNGIQRIFWLVSFAVVGLVGCRVEPITWRVPLEDVILLGDTLAWADLVPDTLWTEGDVGLTLMASTELDLIDADDLLPELDTMWSESFTLPFIGGPIPIAPGTAVWQEEEDIVLTAPNLGLRRVRLGAGLLRVAVASTVDGPLVLRYRLTGATFPPSNNGGSNEVILSVEGDTAEAWLDLTGVVLDLDGPDNLEFNRLKTEWDVATPLDAEQEIGVFGSDVLSLEVALSDIEVAQVEGRFDPQVIAFSDTVLLDAMEPLQELEVGWTSLELALEVRNTTGLDFNVALTEVNRLDSVDGEMTASALVDASLGTGVLVPRATLAGSTAMDDWTISPALAQIEWGSSGSNLSSFLGSIPDGVTAAVELEVNPIGDVSGGYDRVDLTQLPRLEATLTAPLAVSGARAVLRDTLALVPPDGVEFSGELNLTVQNTLPVGALLKLKLVDLSENQAALAVIFGPEWWKFADVEIAAGTGGAEPTLSEATFELMQPHFMALRQGARMVAEVVLETAEGVAQFNTDQCVVIQGHLTGDAIISVE